MWRDVFVMWLNVVLIYYYAGGGVNVWWGDRRDTPYTPLHWRHLLTLIS